MRCFRGSSYRCLQSDPLWQWVGDNLALQQSIKRNGIWPRNTDSEVQLKQQFSDFYNRIQNQSLNIQHVAVASLNKFVSANSSISFSDTPDVSGGRFEDIKEPPPSATFLSNTLKGMVLYVPFDSNVDLAIATNQMAAAAIGLASQDVLSGESAIYFTEGQVTRPDWSAITGSTILSPGSYYYLSATNPGRLSISPPSNPGEYVVSVGRALTEQKFDIQLTVPILL